MKDDVQNVHHLSLIQDIHLLPRYIIQTLDLATKHLILLKLDKNYKL